MKKTVFCIVIMLLALTACNRTPQPYMCAVCNENIPITMKFCPHCGKTIGQDNTQNGIQKSDRSENNPAITPETTVNNETVASAIPPEADFILNRNIYIFKCDFPQVYLGAINNLDKTTAYVIDWKFSHILNESNFQNIIWNLSFPMDGVKTVTFNGVAKNTRDYNTKITIEFYLQDSAKVPLAWKLYIESSNSTSEITLQDFINRGMNSDEALVSVDATICTMLSLFSDEAMQPVTVYYESLADDYMINNNYENAIIYYKKAEIFGEKLSAAYYGKAEKCFTSGDLDTAGQYFSLANGYKDSAVRVLEVYYSAGKKHEQNNDYISAISSYQMAGNYSDSYEKYKECSFKQGEKYANNKQYIEAISCFESAADYSIAKEKYKEACYFYAEQQLLVGVLDSASYYFTQAGDYKDADTRIQRYFYESGNEFFAKKDYLSAAQNYANASNYSDSNTKERQCYYEYGKSRLSLGYTSDGLAYLKLSNGYADANDLIIPYTYQDAKNAFDLYLKEISKYQIDYTKKDIEVYYNTALVSLESCNGYSDSNNLIRILNRAKRFHNASVNGYNMLKEVGSVAGGIYRIEEFSITYDANNIYLQDDRLSPTSGGKAIITASLLNDNFNAKITNGLGHYTSGPWDGINISNIIRAVTALFTEEYNDNDLKTTLANKDCWTFKDRDYSLNVYYGGYDITVEMKYITYSDRELTISGTLR